MAVIRVVLYLILRLLSNFKSVVKALAGLSKEETEERGERKKRVHSILVSLLDKSSQIALPLSLSLLLLLYLCFCFEEKIYLFCFVLREMSPGRGRAASPPSAWFSPRPPRRWGNGDEMRIEDMGRGKRREMR